VLRRIVGSIRVAANASAVLVSISDGWKDCARNVALWTRLRETESPDPMATSCNFRLLPQRHRLCMRFIPKDVEIFHLTFKTLVHIFIPLKVRFSFCTV